MYRHTKNRDDAGLHDKLALQQLSTHNPPTPSTQLLQYPLPPQPPNCFTATAATTLYSPPSYLFQYHCCNTRFRYNPRTASLQLLQQLLTHNPPTPSLQLLQQLLSLHPPTPSLQLLQQLLTHNPLTPSIQPLQQLLSHDPPTASMQLLQHLSTLKPPTPSMQLLQYPLPPQLPNYFNATAAIPASATTGKQLQSNCCNNSRHPTHQLLQCNCYNNSRPRRSQHPQGVRGAHPLHAGWYNLPRPAQPTTKQLTNSTRKTRKQWRS